MQLTTPPLPFDPAMRFPGLVPYARTATRLHPRSGAPTMAHSHVGGPLLWPVGEAWPACPGPHYLVGQWIPLPRRRRWPWQQRTGSRLAAIPGLSGLRRDADGQEYAYGYVTVVEPLPSPMVPVAQLWVRDIPDLPCPPGADVLQVLWCPSEHPGSADQEQLGHRDYGCGPAVHLTWRSSTGIVDVLDPPPPVTTTALDGYRIRPCILHPEQVVEYPCVNELPRDLRRKIEEREAVRPSGEPTYVQVAQAGGWKVGGYAYWDDDYAPHDCPQCTQPMPLLLTVDPAEPRFNIWEPAEERDRPRPDYLEPTGVGVRLRVFACDHCSGTPFATRLQACEDYTGIADSLDL